MKLFIAEKPSMGIEIAKTLSELSKAKISRKDGFIQIGNSIVTWQFGHLMELKSPEQIDKKYKLWSFKTLPILPTSFEKVVKKSCEKQFKIIKSLVHNDKITVIVHAGDPDREGELLINEVLYAVKNKKPVRRLLLNALDSKSIKEALIDLKDDTDFENLYKSAEARCEADWLIGMNLSRGYTLKLRDAGYDKVINIGRVMTPTMCLVVNRENEIKNFKPVKYYKLVANFQHQNGTIEAKLKLPKDSSLIDENGYVSNKNNLINLQKELAILPSNNFKIEKYETVQKTEKQILPYSLSSLQIAAGKKYGYSPQKILDICQELYEKKMTTYPRSDCNYLPTNQYNKAREILKTLNNIEDLNLYIQDCDMNIKSHAWNDSKISAHHAIIPTGLEVKNIDADSMNIYKMIAKVYIAQFYPVYKYNQTDMSIAVASKNYNFVATGKNIVDLGWRKLFTNEDSKEIILPTCSKGDNVIFLDSVITESVTSPPKRFTTSTLLEAMKNINKFVVNPKLKQLLKTTAGIGTEATRAGIIDKLVDKNFLKLEKKKLYPTDLAIYLNEILPKEMKEPDLTAIWEDQLSQIADGKLKVYSFNSNQRKFISDIIDFTKQVKVKPLNISDAVRCPYCGSLLKLITLKKDKSKIWMCINKENCKKGFFNNYNNKPVLKKCPKCNNGYLKQRNSKNGKFWSCDNYPNCKYTLPDENGKPGKSKK